MHAFSGLARAVPDSNNLLKRNIYDEAYPIVGGLAKSWEVAKDWLIYTLRLHEGVKIHNEEDVMRKNRLSFSVFLSAISLAAILAACGPVAKPTTEGGQPSSSAGQAIGGRIGDLPDGIRPGTWGTPKLGGVLRRPNSNEAPSLDVIAEGTNGTHIQTQPLYNTLLEYEYDSKDTLSFPSKIIPGLAERWEVSKDGLTYTFHLRKGVKFHDGKEFTSADAEYSIRRIMDPPPKLPSLRQSWYKGVVAKMATPDPYSFEVTLSDLDAAFTKKIAAGYTPIVPKHVLEPFNARIGVTDIDKLAGTGPFKFVKGERAVSWHLVKNENYWKKDAQGRPLPYLDGMDIFIMKEESSRVAAFRAGQLESLADAMPGVPGMKAMMKEMGDRIVTFRYYSPSGQPGGLQFNTTKKPFDDVRVRKAIVMGIDWPLVLEKALEYDNVGTEACISSPMLSFGEWGIPCEKMMQRTEYKNKTDKELAEAKKILADAGYPNGIDVSILSGYGVTYDNAVQMWQPMLERIGVRVKIKPLERTAYYTAMTTGDFDFNPMGLLASLDDPNDHFSIMWTCGAGRNYGKFCDQKVDQLYYAQAKEMDDAKRKNMVMELQEYTLNQFAMVSTTGPGYASNMAYLKGWLPMGGRHTQFLWETAWLDK